MKLIIGLAAALILTLACNGQDGPGKPDTYTPSPKPNHQWIEPSITPSGVKDGGE